jgi:hypothetical protein
MWHWNTTYKSLYEKGKFIDNEQYRTVDNGWCERNIVVENKNLETKERYGKYCTDNLPCT